MEEQWRDIPGYEGLYQVSDQGRVKSFSWQKRNDQVLRQQKEHGYKFVRLSNNGRSRKWYVHRLVIAAFGKRYVMEMKMNHEVNHCDLIRDNDALSNLETCTHQENITHRSDLFKTLSIRRLEQNGVVKDFSNIRDAAKEHGVKTRDIYFAAKQRTKVAGYFWTLPQSTTIKD
jgi:hypothetical protein